MTEHKRVYEKIGKRENPKHTKAKNYKFSESRNSI